MIDKFKEFEIEAQGKQSVFGGEIRYAGLNPRNGMEMYYLEDGSLTYGDL